MRPVIYTNAQGNYELYWFYPGLHQVKAGNDLTPPLQGEVADKNDKNWSILTAFGIKPPVFLQSISTYLWNADKYPIWAGDQYSPMNLFLADGSWVDCTRDIWLEEIALDSSLTEPYQKIEYPLNILIDNSFLIWTGLEWLPGTPSAPLVGQCPGAPYLVQYKFARHDPYNSPKPVDLNFMTGLTYLDWQGTENGGLNFRVRFSETAEGLSENSPIIGETSGDSLHLILDGSRSGFAMIEVSDGQTGSFSDVFALSTVQIAPLKFTLINMNGNIPEGHLGEGKIEVTNTGEIPIEIVCRTEPGILTLLPPQAVTIQPGGIWVPDFRYEIPPDTLITGLIFDFGECYYPVRFNVPLNPRDPTDVNTGNEILPVDFLVGEPYPNPFNSAVSFRMDSDKRDEVVFQAYNLLGQKVYTTIFNPGKSEIFTWSGIDNRGREVGSGVYFFSFSQGDIRQVRRAILLK